MPNDKILTLHEKKPADNPDHVLEKAKGNYESVLIIGYNEDGELDVRSSLNVSHEKAVWMIETFKHKLVGGEYFES